MALEQLLRSLSDKELKTVLRNTDSDWLVLALKGVADDDQRERVFRALGRTGELIKEDMGYMGPIRLSDAEEAGKYLEKEIRIRATSAGIRPNPKLYGLGEMYVRDQSVLKMPRDQRSKAQIAEAIETLTGEKFTPNEIKGMHKDDMNFVLDDLVERNQEKLKEASKVRRRSQLMQGAPTEASLASQEATAARRRGAARQGAALREAFDDGPEVVDDLEQRLLAQSDDAERVAKERRGARREALRAKREGPAKTKLFGKKIDKWAGDSKVKKALGGAAKGGRFLGKGALALVANPYVGIPLAALEAYHLLSSEGETEGDVIDSILRAELASGGVQRGSELALDELTAPILTRDTALSEVGAELTGQSMEDLTDLNSLVQGRQEMLANIGVQTGASLAEVMARRGMI